MIDFKIDLSKMNHLKEESVYNRNLYSYGNMGVKLLQVCDEEYNTYDYYLVDGENKVFLGSSDGNCDEEEVSLMYMYT
jgi:hypothetical protein